jgi:hypothetical protein
MQPGEWRARSGFGVLFLIGRVNGQKPESLAEGSSDSSGWKKRIPRSGTFVFAS